MTLDKFSSSVSYLSFDSQPMCLNNEMTKGRISSKDRSSHQRCSIKKLFLKIFRNIRREAGLQACNFIKNTLPTHVFSCEYCEIFKNVYFEEHFGTAASTKTTVKGIGNNNDPDIIDLSLNPAGIYCFKVNKGNP